jgi:hypothetical protein
LTGQPLDWWTKNYKVNSYETSWEGGQVRGKTITNRQDFDNEIKFLFGQDYKNYLASPSPFPSLSPPPYPSISPTANPTHIPDPYAKMPSWCRVTIQTDEAVYQRLNYSQGAINEIIKKENPECATY